MGEKNCRSEMPYEAAEKLRNMAKGEITGSFYLGNEKHCLLKTNDETFREIFSENRKYLFRGDFTAPPEDNDYSECCCFISEDGLGGFAVTKTGWLISVFSNYREKGFVRAVSEYIHADRLVCISTEKECRLADMYSSVLGFRIYAMTINDADIMRRHYGDEFIDGFISRHGYPFHIFMIRSNSAESSSVKTFSDYFEAERYVEDSLKSI